MHSDHLRELCLAQPGSFEDFPFGPETSVFKVQALRGRSRPGRAKMFALSQLDARPLSVSLKSDPNLAVELRRTHPEITAAWHLDKRHWNGVDLSGTLQEDLVQAMIEDSWDLVVAGMTRAEQADLGWVRLTEDS